jgi:FkbM family methyltransferase
VPQNLLAAALQRGAMKYTLKKMILGKSIVHFTRRLSDMLKRNRTSELDNMVDDSNLLYDIQTVRVMERALKKDSNCVDVGCHQGSILRNMIRISPNGIHYAFEPLPKMYEVLNDAFETNQNIRLYDCALSDTEGEASFQYVVTNPGYSGLLKRSYERPDEEIQVIAVKTNLLDNVIPRHIPVKFIKIDVEGAELQVLKGAIETIRNSRPIVVFEHGLGAADCYGTGPEDMYDLLAGRCGLELFLMADWLESNGKASLTRDAFCEQFSSGSNYYFMAAP